MNQSRFLSAFLAAVLFACLLCVPAYADLTAHPDQKVVDGAGLFSGSQSSVLEEEAGRLVSQYRFDVVIVTADDFGGKSSQAYADDFFDDNGYGIGSGRDGILFLLNMTDRDFAISTSGKGIDWFNDHDLDVMADNIIDYLSEGDTYQAARTFLADTEILLDYWDNQTSQSSSSGQAGASSQSSRSIGEILQRSFGGAFVVTLIVCAILLAFHSRSLAPAPSARTYLVGGLRMRTQRDTFLHSRTIRQALPKDDHHSGGGGVSSSSGRSFSPGGGGSSRSSSSGRSHGGTSRRF